MPALANRRDSMSAREPERGDHRSVAVVGAGITGLVTAYEMRRRGVNVTLFESSGHSGGAIRTTCTEGFLAEHGPNSFVTSAPPPVGYAVILSDRYQPPAPRRNRGHCA